MKRILLISIITCLLIPFFATNISAAEYDLGTPVLWYPNSKDGGYPESYNYCFYEYPDGEYYGTYDVSWRLWYYSDGYSTSGTFDSDYDFTVGVNSRGDVSYDSVGYKVRASNLDTSKNVLAFAAAYPVRERLYMPAIAYKGIYFPASNQVIKVEFSIDTVKLGTNYDIPSFYDSLLVPSNLCWFELENIPSDQTFKYDKIPFSSVVVTPSSNGKILHYTYYFNAYGTEFQTAMNNSEGSLLQLVVRFPYYFGGSSLLSDGVFCLTNAVLPTSYTIMTPGDYSQELKNIENAIITSNEKLYDMYTEMSDEDIAFIVHSKSQNEKLDSTIKDYDNAQQGINNIVNNAQLPDFDVSDANEAFTQAGLDSIAENDALWIPFVLSIAVITFTFATISLILYGKKG